jgi:hypothetical protein
MASFWYEQCARSCHHRNRRDDEKKGPLEECIPVFFRAQPGWIILGSSQKQIWTLSGETWESEYSKPVNKCPPNFLGIFSSILLMESSDKEHYTFLEQQSCQTKPHFIDFHRWGRTVFIVLLISLHTWFYKKSSSLRWPLLQKTAMPHIKDLRKFLKDEISKDCVTSKAFFFAISLALKLWLWKWYVIQSKFNLNSISNL